MATCPECGAQVAEGAACNACAIRQRLEERRGAEGGEQRERHQRDEARAKAGDARRGIEAVERVKSEVGCLVSLWHVMAALCGLGGVVAFITAVGGAEGNGRLIALAIGVSGLYSALVCLTVSWGIRAVLEILRRLDGDSRLGQGEEAKGAGTAS